MFPVKQCSDLYRVTEAEVQAVRQSFGLTEKSIKEGVDSILEWFRKQPHLAHLQMSRVTVEMMIIISKGSVERSKEKFDNWFKYRLLMPELFQDRKRILCADKIFEIYKIAPLPRLHENRRVSIIKVTEDGDRSKFDLEDFFKIVFMMLDLRMECDYMAGDIFILDAQSVGWKEILSQNLLVLAKVVKVFTKCINWRIYGIHVLNLNGPTGIVQRIIDFVKPFVTQIIMDRVIIHENVEDLYNYVPQESLPIEYGGKELSVTELAERTEKLLKSPKIAEYLLECSRMMSNEKLRPHNENSEEYLSGSFRQLEVD